MATNTMSNNMMMNTGGCELVDVDDDEYYDGDECDYNVNDDWRGDCDGDPNDYDD